MMTTKSEVVATLDVRPLDASEFAAGPLHVEQGCGYVERDDEWKGARP